MIRGFAAMLLVFATQVAAEPAPLAFKEFALGSKIEFDEMRGKMACRLDHTQCNYSPSIRPNAPAQTIGGHPVQFMSIDVSPDGMVDAVHLSFPVDAFDAVREGLKEKYSGELSCEKSTVQNQAGAKFDQERCTVRRGEGTLVATKRGTRVDESSLHIVSRAKLDGMSQRRKADAKDL